MGRGGDGQRGKGKGREGRVMVGSLVLRCPYSMLMGAVEPCRINQPTIILIGIHVYTTG